MFGLRLLPPEITNGGIQRCYRQRWKPKRVASTAGARTVNVASALRGNCHEEEVELWLKSVAGFGLREAPDATAGVSMPTTGNVAHGYGQNN